MRDYNAIARDTVQAGATARALWLSVIEQAVRDSQGKNKANKADLATCLESQWWRHICLNFVGLGTKEFKSLNARIRNNLATTPKDKSKGGGKSKKTAKTRANTSQKSS